MLVLRVSRCGLLVVDYYRVDGVVDSSTKVRPSGLPHLILDYASSFGKLALEH